MSSTGFWNGRRVLVTGHTGFKGAWLSHWLLNKGAKVSGLSLPPVGTNSLFQIFDLAERLESNHFCDIRNEKASAEVVKASDAEIVFHLAAQPLVRLAFNQPVETFATNVMGTAHVLEAIRDLDSCRAILAITTDKVYDNREWVWPYREDDALGGYEPYGASKAACENIIRVYRESYFKDQNKCLTSLRAGNVIGGGDWSDARLMPDLVESLSKGDAIQLRNPHATRPWQHVFEALHGYMMIAEQALESPLTVNRAFNFGPDPADTKSVLELTKAASKYWGGAMDISYDQDQSIKESQLLTLDSHLIRSVVGWLPRWGFEKAAEETIAWYIGFVKGENMKVFSDQQLARFESDYNRKENQK